MISEKIKFRSSWSSLGNPAPGWGLEQGVIDVGSHFWLPTAEVSVSDGMGMAFASPARELSALLWSPKLENPDVKIDRSHSSCVW